MLNSVLPVAYWGKEHHGAWYLNVSNGRCVKMIFNGIRADRHCPPHDFQASPVTTAHYSELLATSVTTISFQNQVFI